MRCSWVRMPKSSTAFFNSCSLVVLNECGCDTKGIDCVERDMEVGATIRCDKKERKKEREGKGSEQDEDEQNEGTRMVGRT
mmetsp:Transcript_37216/g.37690  ORF Transcript_37216/g.37690 Transcript_37216/m.37690 type:complete len:81 (+) Transcript_37216:341-583(+)